MRRDRDADWFDEFWSHLDADVDDEGARAVRLLAELYDADVIDREGDYLIGNDIENDVARVELTTGDQYLVRRIFDAVNVTNRPKL